jgi:ribonuclease HI
MYTIVCDGGSLGNNVKGGGEGYGSFIITPDICPMRFTQHFGPKITNNEAEYLIIITALEYLKSVIGKGNIPLKEIEVTIHTDSQLVVGHLTQNWKISAKNLLPHVARVSNLIHEFGKVVIMKVERAYVFKTLGH